MPIVIFLLAMVAGVIGAVLGIGGGIVVVPALTLVLGLDIHTAVAASTVSVIATSTGAAVAYLNDRITNTRVAMLLEVGTTLGALSGALIAGVVSQRALFILFGMLTAYSGISIYAARRAELPGGVQADPLSARLALAGDYYDRALGRIVSYTVTGALPGLIIMYFSGAMAALLGVGGGALKVLAMDQVMKMPIKVSTATSNFMMGVTAAAGAAVYFMRGEIRPLVAGPVALGVLLGALAGTRLMVRLKGSTLRLLFLPLMIGIAGQMLWKGLGL